MTLQKQEKAMGLYAELMEEVKVRLASVDDAIAGNGPLSPSLTREYVYLQFRMICEVIALGCLVAHGDIPATQEGRLRSAWKADFIMAELEKMHPAFYPVPTEQIQTAESRFHLEPVTSGFLGKGELVKLYGKCGDVLHKGNMKKLLGAQRKDETNTQELIQITQKIRRLLSHHVIHCLNETTLYACGMHEVKTGNVFWGILEQQ